MYTAEGPQKITCCRPQAFDRVGMNFSYSITVIISCPLFLAVTDRAVRSLDLIVALPFIGVTLGRLLGITMHVLLQSLAVCMPTDSQAALPTLSANGSNHRWPIIFIRAVPALLVRSATWRIQRISMLFAFFPPRSGTSRQSQSRNLAVESGSTSHKHSVGFSCATCVLIDVIVQVPWPVLSMVRPCRHHAVATQLVATKDCYQRKWYQCRDCRRSGTSGIGNLQDRALTCDTAAHTGLWHHSLGISVRLGGNTSSPMHCFLVRRANQLSGRSFANFNTHKLFT
jgi:hypothetical protein